jgi:hypothetical protein
MLYRLFQVPCSALLRLPVARQCQAAARSHIHARKHVKHHKLVIILTGRFGCLQLSTSGKKWRVTLHFNGYRLGSCACVASLAATFGSEQFNFALCSTQLALFGAVVRKISALQPLRCH